MQERTSVSLVVTGLSVDPDEVTERVGLEPTATGEAGEDAPGLWEMTTTGPTAFEAPLLAQQLAEGLLERVGAGQAAFAPFRDQGLTRVRFGFRVRPLLRFSFELSPSLVLRLASLGGRIVFGLDDGKRAVGERFGGVARPSDRCEVVLVLRRAGLDPEDVTRRLGCQPTSTRDGEWHYEVSGSPPTEPNELARDLLARLPSPESWTEVRRAHGLQVRFVFFVDGQTGYFTLEEDVARALSALGATWVFVFLNEDA